MLTTVKGEKEKPQDHFLEEMHKKRQESHLKAKRNHVEDL